MQLTGWKIGVLLCTALLAFAYSVTVLYLLRATGGESGHVHLVRETLPITLVLTLWTVIGFPLPLFYTLIFTTKVLLYLTLRENASWEQFIGDISQLSMMTLQITAVSVCALVTQSTLYAVLASLFWRGVTLSAALLVNIATDLVIARHNLPIAVLRTQADSEEMRPFMFFMWVCTAFLLLDSLLCVPKGSEPLLPLLLICSAALLWLLVFWLLRHSYNILKERYLEEENNRLRMELDTREREAAALRDRSRRDALTGAFSRNYILERIELLLQAGQPFSFGFLDLDGLKQINDKDGHDAGDRYLIGFAEAFRARLRAVDVFARFGGDEFAVLLPDCSKADAEGKIEAVRQALTDSEEGCFFFSFGVSSPPAGTICGAEELIQYADQGMYQDKARRKG